MTVVHRQYARLDGFDQVADAAEAWDVDFRLLGNGNGAGVIEAIATARAVVQRNRFGWSLHQRGAAPGGVRTFGVGANSNQRFPWNGQAVEDDWLLAFPMDGAFESVSDETFHAYTLSFDEELIQNTAQVLGLPLPGELLPATGASQPSPGSVRGIRRILRHIVEASREAQVLSSGEHNGLVRVIEWDLLGRILNAFAEGQSVKGPRARLRDLALRRCTAFIEQADGRAVTVRELCEVSGASWRTLDYAFKERYGLAPKAYLRTRRLNAVHSELRDILHKHETIADVASRWGFWHMSQFAADYRKLFGELPSETLRGEQSRS